jgi:hypothetical protein
MLFASPLWLLGLVPWAGVTIWLLLGQGRQTSVPFIKLWRGPVPFPRAKRSFTRPPLAVLLTIFSLFLAVLASARPMLASRSGVPITIIVDRGITMSARGEHVERFKETCERFASQLHEAIAGGSIDLVSVPGDERTNLDPANWTSVAAAMTPIFQDTRSELFAAVRRTLAAGAENVIVFSDQPVPTDPRVIRIEPERAVSNLDIKSISARAIPHAQVMIELRDQGNATDFRKATVHVESDNHSASQEVQIPRDGVLPVFMDLPSLGSSVSVNVDAPDDLAVDNQAWLAREQAPLTIEVPPTLPEPLRRMIAVYQRHREAGGTRVAIVSNPSDAPEDNPSVVISSGATAILPTEVFRVEDHPVSANVDWPAATHFGGAIPPPGYRPIVAAGDMVLVAVRDTPVRSVWVGIDSSDWPKQAGYVIFWTNVFDWLGGDNAYCWHPADDQSKPGIETASDGMPRAYNTINVDFPAVKSNDWRQLHQSSFRPKDDTDLTPHTCLFVLLLMLTAFIAKART